MNAPPRTVPRAGPVLALLCTLQSMLVLDDAIANVALPHVRPAAVSSMSGSLATAR